MKKYVRISRIFLKKAAKVSFKLGLISGIVSLIKSDECLVSFIIITVYLIGLEYLNEE